MKLDFNDRSLETVYSMSLSEYCKEVDMPLGTLINYTEAELIALNASRLEYIGTLRSMPEHVGNPRTESLIRLIKHIEDKIDKREKTLKRYERFT